MRDLGNERKLQKQKQQQQQQRYYASPLRSRQQQPGILHEGRDDEDYSKQVENLQKVLEAKKKNVATLRSQVGNMKTRLLQAGHQKQQQQTNGITNTSSSNYYNPQYHKNDAGTSNSKEEDAKRSTLPWDNSGRNADDSYIHQFSRDDRPSMIPAEMITNSHVEENWRTTTFDNRGGRNTTANTLHTTRIVDRGIMKNEMARPLKPELKMMPYDKDVMELLSKLEDSADTIESLIHQEELNKRTIEHLQHEIRTIKERMADKLSRGEQDLGDAQAENQRLTEQLCLQSDLIASLSAARSAVQLEIDDAKRKLAKAEMEITRVESFASRFQLELRDSKSREAEQKKDLLSLQEHLAQLLLHVTRLEHDCNSKGEENLMQKRSIERLSKENSFLRERGEFMSKELDSALSEMKTRENDHARVQEEHLCQISSLKEKIAFVSEERKQLENSLGCEIRSLEESNQKLNRQVKVSHKEISALAAELEAMRSEKSSLQEKTAMQEEEIKRCGMKNDVLSAQIREITVKQTEAEATIEGLKSEIKVLTVDKRRMEEETTLTVESLRKQMKEAADEKKSIVTQLQGKISKMEESYQSALQKMEGDLAEKISLIASLQFESNLRKEKNALVLARAYKVVKGIKGEPTSLDASNDAR